MKKMNDDVNVVDAKKQLNLFGYKIYFDSFLLLFFCKFGSFSRII